MEKVEHDHASDGHQGHGQRKERDQDHAKGEKDDSQAVKRRSRPLWDCHALGKIIRFRSGDHDTIAGAVGDLIRIEKIHGGDAVSRKRNEQLQTVHDDKCQKPRENDVEAFWLRGFLPEDINEKERCLCQIGGKSDPKEVFVGVGCQEKTVYESSGEEGHRDVSEDRKDKNDA